VRATGTGALPLLLTEVSWAAVVMAEAAAADSARALASRWRARRAAQRLGGAPRGRAVHALAMLSSVRAALRFARARRWAAVSRARAGRCARACKVVLMFSRLLVRLPSVGMPTHVLAGSVWLLSVEEDAVGSPEDSCRGLGEVPSSFGSNASTALRARSSQVFSMRTLSMGVMVGAAPAGGYSLIAVVEPGTPSAGTGQWRVRVRQDVHLALADLLVEHM
jgi:hypothetical protein